MVNIVAGGVKRKEVPLPLHVAQQQAYGIAQQQSAAYDKDSIVEEDPSDQSVACSQCLEDAYGGCALQYEDEQSADNGEAAYAGHEAEDYPDVEVEQLEPVEDGTVELADAIDGIVASVAVWNIRLEASHLVGYVLGAVEVSDGYLECGTREAVPAVEAVD